MLFFNPRKILTSWIAFCFCCAIETFATEEGPAGRGVDEAGFHYNKEHYEGYYLENDMYRTLGSNSWTGVVHGIAKDRGYFPEVPKDGELSSMSFHTAGLSWPDDQLDEWFRRGLLPSIIFALTGVVQDERYAISADTMMQQRRNAARVFCITFMSGRYLGEAFASDSKTKKGANVFGASGLNGLHVSKDTITKIRKIRTEGFGDTRIFMEYAMIQPILRFPSPLSLDSYPKDDAPLLTDFFASPSTSEFNRAQEIDEKVRPLFKILSAEPILLETARYFHKYKLKEESLHEERSRFSSWDDERKKEYNAQNTHVSQVTNALQYYVFKYIQEVISHALDPEYPASPICVEEPNYRALMKLVKSEPYGK